MGQALTVLTDWLSLVYLLSQSLHIVFGSAIVSVLQKGQWGIWKLIYSGSQRQSSTYRRAWYFIHISINLATRTNTLTQHAMPEENTNKAQDNSTTHLGHICVIDTTYIGQGCENSRLLTDRHMAAEVLCKARFCQQSSAHTDRTVLLYTRCPYSGKSISVCTPS